MKTQTYESVIIINATLDDSQIGTVINRVEETITTNGGKILDIEKWGRKRLAYPIQKSKNGYYVISRFTAPTEAIIKIERMYRLDETIVRYLTTVMEAKDIANFEKVKHDRAIEAEQAANNSVENIAAATEPEKVVEIVEPTETADVKVEEADVSNDDE